VAAKAYSYSQSRGVFVIQWLVVVLALDLPGDEVIKLGLGSLGFAFFTCIGIGNG
jgi:hypothetical protein